MSKHIDLCAKMIRNTIDTFDMSLDVYTAVEEFNYYMIADMLRALADEYEEEFESEIEEEFKAEMENE